MGRKAIYSPEDKLQIVLSVLRGETTQTEISRRLQMNQTTIAKWQRQFLDGGADGAVEKGARVAPQQLRERRPQGQRPKYGLLSTTRAAQGTRCKPAALRTTARP